MHGINTKMSFINSKFVHELNLLGKKEETDLNTVVFSNAVPPIAEEWHSNFNYRN